MENNNKKYSHCILVLRKKSVDNKENKKGHCPLRRIAAKMRPESQEQDERAQKDVRYLSKQLWESYNPE